MKCTNCLQEIPEDVNFCPNCGTKVEAAKTNTAEETFFEPDDQSPEKTGGDPVQETDTAEKTGGYDLGYQQNTVYDAPPVYQSDYRPEGSEEPVNWVPYLVLSIISTVCCCVPFGIVSIVYAVKINNSVTAGDLQEAQRNAKTARIWLVAAFVTGILINVLLSVVYVGLLGAGNYYYF